jgi:hypothetical protein
VWRLLMPDAELEALLAGAGFHMYVVRTAQSDPMGFCEFDRANRRVAEPI